MPALVEYYLGEKPILASVPTYQLDDPDVFASAMSRMDRLVFKPVDGSGGYGLVIGPHASDEELAELQIQVSANPRGWIAQEVVALSTAPTYAGSAMAPRHVDLRPFAVNDGEQIWVVPGGLTRVALPEGSLVVNSSQGGGSKDTWVLAGTEASPDGGRFPAGPAPRTATRFVPPTPGPSATQAAQQQQQQQQRPSPTPRLADGASEC